MTRVLVIGGGGREHAICRALATADPALELVIAPGNPGTARCGENVAVGAGDIVGLVALARERAVDLVVVGPEQPLVGGIGDALAAAKIPCCGPSGAAARLEGSKLFTRELCAKAGVPSPHWVVVRSRDELAAALETWDATHGVPVVKADGLAAGKGVFLPDDRAGCLEAGEALLSGSLGAAGETLLLEERMVGIEASLFYACDGTNAIALPHARDHKRLLDGDRGPNTGGMGAVSPNDVITDEIQRHVTERIVAPTLHALADAGTPFCGFLFVGLMLTDHGPKLLEYNVRLGDPEAQAILPRLGDGDMLALCEGLAAGNVGGIELGTKSAVTCAVVLAADGYPGTPRKGDAIEVDVALRTSDRWLIHAGTRFEGSGSERLVTAGGRVAVVVASAPTLPEACRHAYRGVGLVDFAGKRWRTDIGEMKNED